MELIINLLINLASFMLIHIKFLHLAARLNSKKSSSALCFGRENSILLCIHGNT